MGKGINTRSHHSVVLRVLAVSVFVTIIFTGNLSAAVEGCIRDFNADGSETPCYKQHIEAKRQCPYSGQTCMNPDLAGIWRYYRGKEKKYLSSRRPPSVSGWIIKPDGDVFKLAIDFKTGRLAQGRKDWSFNRVTYGCHNELYQQTYFVGYVAMYCGRYKLKDNILKISQTKSSPFSSYRSVAITDKIAEPVEYAVDISLDNKPIIVPDVAERLPVYAIQYDSKFKVRINNADHNISIVIPQGISEGILNDKSAGKVRLKKQINDHVSMELDSTYSGAGNEIEIVSIDNEKGRVKARFNYLLRRINESYRFKGVLDIKLYRIKRKK